jgi:hypothetical protein
MNQRAQQEILIAEKLEQLSIPDMVDAIWSRIENQLDIDLPTDEGPGGPDAPSQPGKGAWVKPGIFLFVTAFFITIYFIINKKDKSSNSLPAETEKPLLISPDQPEKGPPGIYDKLNQKYLQTDQNGQLIPFTDSGAADLSVTPENINSDSVPQPVPDNNPVILMPPADLVIPDTVKKKSRGVKGINPGDYKVVPSKKDSAG